MLALGLASGNSFGFVGAFRLTQFVWVSDDSMEGEEEGPRMLSRKAEAVLSSLRWPHCVERRDCGARKSRKRGGGTPQGLGDAAPEGSWRLEVTWPRLVILDLSEKLRGIKDANCCCRRMGPASTMTPETRNLDLGYASRH